MAYRAPLCMLGGILYIQVAQETDVCRDLHMLSLDDIGMAAPAVEVYTPPVLGEMGLVVEGYIPFCENDLGFYQPPLMTALLEAVRIRHIGQGPRVVCARYETELSREGLQWAVFVAFEARHHIMGRPLPLIVKRGYKMTVLAYSRPRHHHLFHKKIDGDRKYQNNAENYDRYLHLERLKVNYTNNMDIIGTYVARNMVRTFCEIIRFWTNNLQTPNSHEKLLKIKGFMICLFLA